ncbi:MAG: aminoacyl-tRNA hydrolase [Syntrophobacteraceae bacterium]
MSRQDERDERIAVISGLGNPGKQYDATRHNVGFRVLDGLAGAFCIMLQERKFKAAWGTGIVEGEKVHFIKPLTYMNRSGEAVGEMLRYFNIPASRMLVIHDDLDLVCGRILLARRGGAGGHRGVQSIIDHIGNQDFPRLRLGIGRPVHGEPIESFVLDKPYPDDVKVTEAMINQGIAAAIGVLSSGLSAAMNRFNKYESNLDAPS